MSDPIPAEIAVRLLRAKAAELERRLVDSPIVDRVDYLAADLGLVAELLADLIERIESSTSGAGELRHLGRMVDVLRDEGLVE